MSLFLVAVLASNLGLGFLRDSAVPNAAQPAGPLHSQPASLPMLGSGIQHDPRQAYIWAPIGETPRHVRRGIFANDMTDTENSPEPTKALMAPQTPSGRRSPSKGDRERERGRSPSKMSRSPSKGY